MFSGDVLAGVGWPITRQVSNLVAGLPRHPGSTKAKSPREQVGLQKPEGQPLETALKPKEPDSLMQTAFMLFNREDPRNWVILLLGQERMTTKSIADAARRVSRFMLLWGFITFLLRYTLYRGTWL